MLEVTTHFTASIVFEFYKTLTSDSMHDCTVSNSNLFFANFESTLFPPRNLPNLSNVSRFAKLDHTLQTVGQHFTIVLQTLTLFRIYSSVS